VDRSDVLTARLATQRLTGPPAAGPAQVVRELLCVQAQDAPLARAMIALRCGGTEADVLASVARGEIVRTHLLRPTWHYVAAEDLRWLLELTSPKVESGMASRHRQLGLGETRVATALDVLSAELAGRRFRTRPELGAALAAADVLSTDDPLFGQQVGHVLLLAELRALVCSAPSDDTEHRYALVAEVVAATPQRSREDALTELVGRYVAGHGPVALTDLLRWAKVTLGEARTALRALDGQASRLEVDGDELWHSPASALPQVQPRRAWLLSTFDEAFLSYRKVPWPRSSGHPAGDDAAWFAQAGGGPVLCDLADVGTWKRTVTRDGVRVELMVDAGLPADARAANDAAAADLADVIGRGPLSSPTPRLGAEQKEPR
jgi:hypothetical protein